MLTIVHGSDIVSSRNFFLTEKSKFTSVVFLKGSEVGLTDLHQLLEGGGLFEDIKVLFIEQFLSERRKSVERDSILSYIKKKSKTNKIFFWEGKELSRSELALFKEAVVRSHKLPSTLFYFLDSISPGNGAQLVRLFHKSLEATGEQMVFFMLVRHFRILLALSDRSGETISEVSRLAAWQKSKLKKQAVLFEKDFLIRLYSDLFRIEKEQKTGGMSSTLTFAIDKFLIGI